jgi:hypothetical protein
LGTGIRIAGTTLAELQDLCTWKSESTVKRYAHFARKQFRAPAAKNGYHPARHMNAAPPPALN